MFNLNMRLIYLRNRLSVSGRLPYIVGFNVAVFASLVSEEPAALCVGSVNQDLVAVLPAVTVDDFAVGGLAHGQAGSAVIMYNAVYVADDEAAQIMDVIVTIFYL